VPRYQVSGIPPSVAAVGLSAFMPHYNRLAASGAQAYKGQVTGRPGTSAIPVSGLGFPVPSPDLGDLALTGGARSSDAPAAIWPNQYYDNPAGQGEGRFYPGAGMPVQVYDPVAPWLTTHVPVPAIDLRGVYQARSANLAGGISNDRSKALRQATSFVRWPRRRSGNGPGTGG
jgi:hypothetical protein